MYKHKYTILILGYILLWGGYFGYRAYQYQTMETATGEITRILRQNFRVGAPPGHGDDYTGQFQCPEIRFLYKSSSVDTGAWHLTSNESYAPADHRPGEKTAVIFPKGHPEQARIYSLGEFWLLLPYMIILCGITLFWSIGFYVYFFVFRGQLWW